MIKLCKHEHLSDNVFEELIEDFGEPLLMQFTQCLDCGGWVYTGPTIRIDLTKP